jgi:hypothetical protein
MANQIPFYDTYIQRKAQNEAEPVRQMGQLAQFATLQQHFAQLEQAKREQERMAKFREEMSTAKSPDEQRAVAARYAAPDAVLRMPQPTVPTAPAPTLTTVADPSRPGKNLRVDARAYKGGGIGSPGVLGEVLPTDQPERSPYYDTLRTADGRLVWVNKRDPKDVGLVTLPQEPGKPLIAAQDDPGTRGRVKEAEAGGQVTGKDVAEARIELPKVEDTSEMGLRLIDELVGSQDGKTKRHPGFESYVGFTLMPGMRFVEGSKEADFEKRLKQITGGSFLEAFSSLRGSGAITELEGQRATEAINRMDKATSEKEFIRAARDVQQVIRKGVERAKFRAKTGAVPAPAQGGSLTPQEEAELQSLRKKYGRSPR